MYNSFGKNEISATGIKLTNTLNDLWKQGEVDQKFWESGIRKLLLMIAPLAPHIAEELWEVNGLEYSIHSQEWPKWEPEFVKEADINLVVQVNGKVRDTIIVSAEITENAAKEAAIASKKIETHIKDKEIKKTIYVPGKLVNIVAL